MVGQRVDLLGTTAVVELLSVRVCFQMCVDWRATVTKPGDNRPTASLSQRIRKIMTLVVMN